MILILLRLMTLGMLKKEFLLQKKEDVLMPTYNKFDSLNTSNCSNFSTGTPNASSNFEHTLSLCPKFSVDPTNQSIHMDTSGTPTPCNLNPNPLDSSNPSSYTHNTLLPSNSLEFVQHLAMASIPPITNSPSPNLSYPPCMQNLHH